MAAFDFVTGKKALPFDQETFEDRRARADRVLVDVGTGQGKFIQDAAREDPNCFCIGLDAVAENMSKTARQCSANPKKGGLPNALFLRAAAEGLPGPLAGIADSLTVQYPWGSLMRMVAAPDPVALARLRAICKPGAKLSILLNHTVLADRPYMARLGMEDVQDPAENEQLNHLYEEAGFTEIETELFFGDPPVRTAWGRQLVRGADRATYKIEGVARDDD